MHPKIISLTEGLFIFVETQKNKTIKICQPIINFDLHDNDNKGRKGSKQVNPVIKAGFPSDRENPIRDHPFKTSAHFHYV